MTGSSDYSSRLSFKTYGVLRLIYVSTNATTAVNEFANQWNSTRQSVARDLAHMWTGKNFDGVL